MNKRSVYLGGRATSISLEPEFYDALKRIAEEREVPLRHLVEQVDEQDDTDFSLTSKLRRFVLRSVAEGAGQGVAA